MKFIDLFAGIGGFRSGLERAGHECVAFCEIDKYARQSYKAIYNTEGESEYHDITEISGEEWRKYRGTVDIICGGFPCQAFSIAGKRRGFEDTRGTLFFDIARAIKQIKPSYAFLENVRGLFSHDKGRTFTTIISALDEMGYIVEWGMFNSKYWGVPQNRERVFIIATRKDVFEGPMLFDLLQQQTEVTTKLADILEDDVDQKYFLKKEKVKNLLAGNEESIKKGYLKIREATKKGYAEASVGDSVNVAFPNSKTRRGRVGKGLANTLEASGINQGVIINPLKEKSRKSWRYEQNVVVKEGLARSLKASLGGTPELFELDEEITIRKFTPLECWRLQGFADDQYYNAKATGISESGLYKQAGNSVTVNVIEAIARGLK